MTMQRAPISTLPLFRPEPPPPSPEEARDAVLDTLDRKRRGYLAKLRTEMELLYWKRHRVDPDTAFVTADDAREVFEAWPGIPDADELSRNFLGSLFRGRRWTEVGTARSRTPGRNASLVRKWALLGES